jgi:hypothetical protein
LLAFRRDLIRAISQPEFDVSDKQANDSNREAVTPA